MNSDEQMGQSSKSADAAMLDGLAEEAALDLIRQAPRIDFWVDCVSTSLGAWNFAAWLKLPKDHGIQSRFLAAAVKRVGKSYRAFVTESSVSNLDGNESLTISVKLKDGYEWRDAMEEAWKLSPNPNPHGLTDNARKILRWLENNDLKGKQIDQNAIGRRANVRGTFDHIVDYLKEIQVKANPRLVFEKANGWHGPLRIWFAEATPQYYSIGPLNPQLSLPTGIITRGALEQFKSWLYSTIRNTSFKNDLDVIGVFDIRDRKTAISCFHDLPKASGFSLDYEMRKFFSAVRLIDGIELRSQFSDGFGPWLVICKLQEGTTWEHIQRRLEAMEKETPLDKKYGLSRDSAALLKWVIELRADQCLRTLTPSVEDHIQLDIGLDANWPEENLAAYLELLVEEINEKTEFDLRIQTWHHYGKAETRIRVKMKRLELESVVQTVQLYCLKNNRVLSRDQVEQAIKALLS